MNERIKYEPNTPVGAKIRAYVSALSEGRKNGAELNRIVSKYADDDAALALDSGISEIDLPTFKNLVNMSQAELNDLALNDVPTGQQTSARQITDAMG